MPQFTVHVQQYVEEVAELVIEADTAEEAVSKAEDRVRDGDVDEWRDGDDVIHGAAAECGCPVWQAYDDKNELVWER